MEAIRNSDDQELVQGVLAGEDAAWRELMRRSEVTVRKRIRRVLARFRAAVKSSDLVDEVLSDFYLGLVTRDSRHLRRFDASRGSLVNWLCVLAEQKTLRHMRGVLRRPEMEQLEAAVEQEDPQRGAKWIAEGT